MVGAVTAALRAPKAEGPTGVTGPCPSLPYPLSAWVVVEADMGAAASAAGEAVHTAATTTAATAERWRAEREDTGSPVGEGER